VAKKLDTTERLFDSQDAAPSISECCYSGDQPNPNLRKFVEEHATLYNLESDNYHVAAFNKPITSTKATAIYLMHSYHQGKKPHDAIREYIRHYTRPGDLVLDVFSGSGGTSLAALLEGRRAVAIDRSPAATFITKNYCSPIDSFALRQALENVIEAVKHEADWLYGTVCDRCGGSATVAYTVYSQVFQCPRCLKQVASYDCPEVEGETAGGKPRKVRVCPHCLRKNHHEEISSGSETFGHIPVVQCYICENKCRPLRSTRNHKDTDTKKRQFFEKHDIGRLKDIDAKPIPHWYPPHKMMNVDDDSVPWGAEWRPGRNFRTVAELFTKRNLWAMAAIRDAILKHAGNQQDMLLFALNAITLNCSRMYRFRESLKGGFQQGTYYIPQESQVINVFRAFCDKVEDLCRASASTTNGGDFIVSTQSACRLDSIPSNSIDYVFTDPPYSHTVQYGELNFIWEAWLGFDTSWQNEEIIVNDVRGRTDADWAALMKKAMNQCFRVLKPGRWLTLCFHDEEGTWALVQDFMAEVGFIVDKTDSALFIDTGQKSYNQNTADKARKRDLVLNFRKPNSLLSSGTQVDKAQGADGGDIATFMENARQLVRDFLTQYPGSTKDRIYDELVSRFVSSSSMEAHDFDSLLKSVADDVQEPVKEDLFRNKEADLWGSHVQSRWYLKETADQIDHAEQAKEDAAAARLSKFIGEYLEKKPEYEGVHYSDLFEQYLPVHDKPRRLLADWLVEYFIKTASGTWRLPNKEEGQQLANLREAGTLRRIKRFANTLIEGVPVRDKDRPGSDVDLLNWLRQCRRAGLYEQGKAIFEKGGLNSASLTDEQQIEAEDDYRICARRGSAEEAKPKRQRRKTQDDDE
jgi:16S rRNA G966 N2-methylase RsmD